MGGALLLVQRHRSPKAIYGDVDWSLLILFLGLFLIIGGAEQAGITRNCCGAAEQLNLHNPVIFTAVVTLLSNIVSNVPAVMLLKGLMPQFHDPHTAWLMLAMSSTLAGNLTITGSVANIIVVEKARSRGAHRLSRVHEDRCAGDRADAGGRVALAGIAAVLSGLQTRGKMTRQIASGSDLSRGAVSGITAFLFSNVGSWISQDSPVPPARL